MVVWRSLKRKQLGDMLQLTAAFFYVDSDFFIFVLLIYVMRGCFVI